MNAFMKRQTEKNNFSIVDPANIGQVFMDMTAKMMADPMKLAKSQQHLWFDHLKLWQSAAQRIGGLETEVVVEPSQGDRRFKDKTWEEDLTYDYIKQSYLLVSRWVQSVVSDVKGLSPKQRQVVEFYTRQFVSAVSPSNFIATNPT